MLRATSDLRAFVLSDPLCQRLAALAGASGVPLLLVGGWVRDWLLGRPCLDWDLIVAGDPAPLLKEVRRSLGRSAVTLDEGFGVYRVAMPDGPLVDFTRIHGKDVEEDLWRRDLTVNALACRLTDGELLDPTGGYADLQARRVRAPSRRNLEDDPLRLLRVFRFAAKLPGEVDATTLGWVRELAPRIATSATERVWAEMGKLAASPEAPRVLSSMEESGLLAALLPEGASSAALPRLFEALAGLDERAREALDEGLTNDRPKLALLVMAVLLRLHPQALAGVMERWRWSKREAAWVQRLLAGLALHPAHDERSRFRLLKAAEDALPGLAALVADPEPLLAAYWQRVDHPAARLIAGDELIRELGLKPGPAVATLLAGIEEAQAAGELHDRAGALAWARVHMP